MYARRGIHSLKRRPNKNLWSSAGRNNTQREFSVINVFADDIFAEAQKIIIHKQIAPGNLI
jgi:hypothetical protein